MLIWTSCLPLDCKDEFVDQILNYVGDTITPLVDQYVPIDQYPVVHDLTGILGFQVLNHVCLNIVRGGSELEAELLS